MFSYLPSTPFSRLALYVTLNLRRGKVSRARKANFAFSEAQVLNGWNVASVQVLLKEDPSELGHNHGRHSTALLTNVSRSRLAASGESGQMHETEFARAAISDERARWKTVRSSNAGSRVSLTVFVSIDVQSWT